MKRMGKFLSVALAALCVVGLSGCSGADTRWVARVNEDETSAGEYILHQMEGYYEVQDRYLENLPEEEAGTTGSPKQKDVMATDMDGKSASDYITEKARQMIQEYYFVAQECEAQGIGLTEQDMALLAQNNEMVWSYMGDFYEKNKVGTTSTGKLALYYYMRDLLMTDRYSEGGELAISDEELKTLYQEQKARVRYMHFPILDVTKSQEEQPDPEAVKATAQSYFDRLKAGESVITLANEYTKATAVEGTTPTEVTEDNVDRVISRTEEDPLSKELGSATLGEPVMVFDEVNGYYVGVRLDILEDTADFEGNRRSLIASLKQEEFDAWIKESAASVAVEFNQAAIDRYKPSKLKMNMAD